MCSCEKCLKIYTSLSTSFALLFKKSTEGVGSNHTRVALMKYWEFYMWHLREFETE